MASKTNFPESTPEVQTGTMEPLPIEKHCAGLGISKPVFAGVCAANGWKPGKVMTESEFCRAVREFTGAPMGSKAVT